MVAEASIPVTTIPSSVAPVTSTSSMATSAFWTWIPKPPASPLTSGSVTTTWENAAVVATPSMMMPTFRLPIASMSVSVTVAPCQTQSPRLPPERVNPRRSTPDASDTLITGLVVPTASMVTSAALQPWMARPSSPWALERSRKEE